jgi:large subunit ribosomal protein L35
MPKMKSHSGLKKRVKVTARGKVLHKPGGARHLMISKNAGSKRHKRKQERLAKRQEQIVHKLLPYA